MTTQRLQTHYDDKYAQERTTSSELPVVALRLPHPVGRHEAACAVLPDRLPPSADILELGAGDGLIANSLARGGVDFGSYTVGDISTVRLEGLSRRLRDDRFRFRAVDADDVTADLSETYDAVVMVALIEHLVDPIDSMDAVRRVLKPGGFVYVDTPNIAKWTRRIKLAAGRFPATASTDEGLTTYAGQPTDLHDEGHLHYFTFRSLELLLTRRCGFARVERVGYHPGGPPGRRLGTWAARRRPTLFSELACLAYA
ncbi:MAG: methyltransferase domain-containing protein [Actinomycetes bacterium]